jgi:hypothetical protein
LEWHNLNISRIGFVQESGTHNCIYNDAYDKTYFFFWGLFLNKLILVTFQPSRKHSAACFQQLQFHHKGPTNERNAKWSEISTTSPRLQETFPRNPMSWGHWGPGDEHHHGIRPQSGPGLTAPDLSRSADRDLPSGAKRSGRWTFKYSDDRPMAQTGQEWSLALRLAEHLQLVPDFTAIVSAAERHHFQ